MGTSTSRQVAAVASVDPRDPQTSVLLDFIKPKTKSKMNGNLDAAILLNAFQSQDLLKRIVQYQNGIDNHLHEAILKWDTLPDTNTQEKFLLKLFNIDINGIEIVQQLYIYRSKVFTTSLLVRLAKHGYLNVISYLDSVQYDGFTPQVMDAAARNGQLQIVKYLHENRFEGCTTAAMDNAAYHGDMAMILYLHKYRHEGCTKAAFNYAARSGHFELVKFLHENRLEGCTTDAMDGAAANGHFQVVQYLHIHRNEGCTDAALKSATEKGNLEMVQFLYEAYGGNMLNVLVWASRKGHLEIVKYMHETRKEACIRFNHQVRYCAAERGHTAIVEYLKTIEIDA